MPAPHAPPPPPLLPAGMPAPPDPVVAVIDDDPLYVDYLTGLLALEGITRVEHVDAREELFPRLSAIEADCLVIDYDLGRDNGFNVASRIIAERRDAPGLVMITGTGSERTVVKAMRMGFHDYVSKRTLTGGEMKRAIRRAVAARRPVLVPAAPVDDGVHAPTGLPSRGRMEAMLETLCAPRSRRPFTFCLVEPDLDEVGATLGIAATERARESFVYALRKARASKGLLAHWEGDRFAFASDEEAAPEPFGEAMRALPGALERTIAVDGAWARIAAHAGGLLLPIGRHDPVEVATATAALLDGARQAGDAERHEVRGDHAANAGAREDGTGNERRRARRMRCLRLARIVLPGDRAVVDCVVMDMSTTGARLKTKSFFVAPDAFSIEVVGSGVRRPARVAWQRGAMLGVTYTDDAAPGAGMVH